jgi:CheY-like chemotaxis protein
MMPELDGLGTGPRPSSRPDDRCHPGRSAHRHAPSRPTRSPGCEAGADAYLVKPFDPGVLTACVANLLHQRRRLLERFGRASRLRQRPCRRPHPRLDLRLRPLVEGPPGGSGFGTRGAGRRRPSSPTISFTARSAMSSAPPRPATSGRSGRSAPRPCSGRGLAASQKSHTPVGFESLSYFRRALQGAVRGHARATSAHGTKS